jgi:T-complex protein 1 subunit delta
LLGFQLVELSKSQDIEAGDGTTSVTVFAGALLSQVLKLLEKGLHPTIISESFQKASRFAQEVLKSIGKPVELNDRETLIKMARTSLNSKVVSQYSDLLAPLAVDAVLRVIDCATAENVDLRDVKVVKKVGGTIDDTELIEGLVFDHDASHAAGGPTRVANAKIGLIQFQLSAPKTNMENQVVIDQYHQMDRILKEERAYILEMCKAIKKTGCNVLLIQKSILRDAVNDMSLNFLAKLGIMVVRDIERDDIEFISKTVNAIPIASIEGFSAAKLGTAKLVEEVAVGEGKVVKITGVPNAGKTVSVLVQGSNRLVVDEAERSLHDALCVVRSIVRQKFLLVGGGAPEIEVAMRLETHAKAVGGMESYCYRGYAEALQLLPYTLAENAGLNPIAIVTELRNRHALGEISAGINVRKNAITDLAEENVLQPMLVTSSMMKLATETVCMILKIDDIVRTR